VEGPLKKVLEHPKSPDGPDFIDATASGFTYDTLDHLQCPHIATLMMKKFLMKEGLL
jgi:hypothetical protein